MPCMPHTPPHVRSRIICYANICTFTWIFHDKRVSYLNAYHDLIIMSCLVLWVTAVKRFGCEANSLFRLRKYAHSSGYRCNMYYGDWENDVTHKLIRSNYHRFLSIEIVQISTTTRGRRGRKNHAKAMQIKAIWVQNRQWCVWVCLQHTQILDRRFFTQNSWEERKNVWITRMDVGYIARRCYTIQDTCRQCTVHRLNVGTTDDFANFFPFFSAKFLLFSSTPRAPMHSHFHLALHFVMCD